MTCGACDVLENGFAPRELGFFILIVSVTSEIGLFGVDVIRRDVVLHLLVVCCARRKRREHESVDRFS